MVSAIAKTLWGSLTWREYKKYGLLSAVFFFIIGSYWMLKTMKNGIFMKTVGSDWLPAAKATSVVFMILLVMFYAKLIDILEKHTLVYVFTISYGLIFLAIAYFINHPVIGILNTHADPHRIFGWVVYLTVESFGSLVVALFWSFVASSMDTVSAKRGYPIILSGAQLGSVLGCLLDARASKLGLQFLFFVVSIAIFIIPLLIKIFVTHYSSGPRADVHDENATGLVEGLRLLVTKPYLMGVLAVATLYEIIGTIFDYQMKVLANQTYHSAAGVTEFDAIFGLMVNLLSFVFALVGTSYFLRNHGLRFCLVAYPISVACAICFMWLFYGLWIIAIGMVAIRGLNYALNNPCKEILYIPTSKDVKFKAKSWIDVFGGRLLKAAGSGVNALFPILSELLVFGSLISFGVIGIWVAIAVYVGRTNHYLVKQGKIIR